MKKRRVFLAASLLVVAAAGVFATKASAKFQAIYYYKPDNSACTTANFVCTTTGSNLCQKTEISGDPTLYQVYTDHLCQTPLTYGTAK